VDGLCRVRAPCHAALADGKRSLLHKLDNRLLLRGVVRIECASRVLLKDEVQKLDEFLLLQVGERLEDAHSDLLLQRRRIGHRARARNSLQGERKCTIRASDG